MHLRIDGMQFYFIPHMLLQLMLITVLSIIAIYMHTISIVVIRLHNGRLIVRTNIRFLVLQLLISFASLPGISHNAPTPKQRHHHNHSSADCSQFHTRCLHQQCHENRRKYVRSVGQVLPVQCHEFISVLSRRAVDGHFVYESKRTSIGDAKHTRHDHQRLPIFAIWQRKQCNDKQQERRDQCVASAVSIQHNPRDMTQTEFR
mmetsp:Transcript_36361/g.58348  ORF Transcript_36361/g.58348 Transcript_36361/m.58348 type:complete len:203 (+) Transcript_36361:293-901(+)